jgi:chaperonin GroES|uniref:Co-chaperonin GroES n=1 Tax=uncultured virus TaxID=340016 RepID=A0A221S378_9VIRU|nr:co-chaperonin GroES [uncultured virus]
MYIDLDIKPETLAKLPKPSGYRVLIITAKTKEKTSGGVYLPDELRQAEDTASILGRVLSLGPDAYGDEKRYPSGPFCKEGDHVIFRSYSGTRLKVDGVEFRLIDDDTVQAVVADPSDYERAF